MEKLKYKSFTSKLSYMTKSALPVRKRKASFMTTNDYRITCLFVLGEDGATLPAINRLKSLHHMNVIYAGTGILIISFVLFYYLNERFIEILFYIAR